MNRRATFSPLLIAFAAAFGAARAPAAPQGDAPRANRVAEIIPRQPYDRYWTTDSLGRRVNFYLSEHRADRPLPLVLYVQGSGFGSHFVRRGDRVVGNNGHNTIHDVFLDHAHVLLVDKPGVDFLDDGSAPSAEFRREHTLPRWCAALMAALAAARTLDFVDPNRTLVLGHSEGGLVACKLAADLGFVTHVASLAGGGGSQLFDLLLLARRGEFFTGVSDDPAQRERYLLDAWAEIRRQPDRADEVWFGHSYRRWSTFLQTSPMQQLQHTDARVFLAQGTADRAVTTESFDLLRTQLLAWGKDVTARRVEGADHSFHRTEGGEPVDGWREIMTEVLDWFGAP